MHPALEAVVLLFTVIWLWLVAIVKAIMPASLHARKDVRGQIVLITGAGSGLGRLMSQRFAQLGARLVLWDVNEQANKETEELVKSLGADVMAYTVDLSKREKIYEVAGKVKTDMGDVDVLVNNAGIVTGKKFLDCPDHLIEKTMEINTNAHFWTLKAFLPAMITRDHGHVVTIASSAGMFGVSGLCDYCASKFAAVGLEESLRGELSRLGKKGVKTTVVCPFYINTGMFAGVKSKFIPILKPEDAVNSIMDAILTDQPFLMMPRLMYLFYLLKGILPVNVGEVLADFFEINHGMDEFVGRAKTN